MLLSENTVGWSAGARRGRGGALAPRAHTSLASQRRHTPHPTRPHDTQDTRTHTPGTRALSLDVDPRSTGRPRSRHESSVHPPNRKRSSDVSRCITLHRLSSVEVSLSEVSLTLSRTCSVSSGPLYYKNALHATKGSVHAPYNRDYHKDTDSKCK